MSKNFGKATDLIDFSRSSGGTALRKISYGPDAAPLLSAYGIVGSGTWAASGSDYVFEDTVGSQVRPGVSWPTNGLSSGIYLVEINIASITGATQVRVDGIGATDQLIGAGESSFVIQVTSKSTPRIRIEDTSTSIGDGFALTSFSVKPVLFDQADGDLVVFNHPADIPRIEYAADGSVKGLLVEEARTNRFAYSASFSDWTEVRASLSDNTDGVLAPDGSVSKALISDTTPANSHITQMNAVSPAANSIACGSVFLKKQPSGIVTHAQVRLVDDAAGGNNRYAIMVDLSTGAITDTGTDNTVTSPFNSVQSVGDGWYRVSLGFTKNNTATRTDMQVILSESATMSASTPVILASGDGTSGLYLWGVQLEEGAFPTSYIPTSGATATRSADVASIDTSAFGYRQSEGTVVASYYAFSGQGSTVRIASLNDVSASNSFQMALLDAGTTYHEVRSGGAAVVTTVLAGAITDNALTKTAVASSLDDHAGATNGGTVGTDTIGAMPIGVTALNIGSHYSGNFPFNGHIKSLKYYPRRLTNAQLQELTT